MSQIIPDKKFSHFTMFWLGVSVVVFPMNQSYGAASPISIVGTEETIHMVVSPTEGIPMMLTGDIHHLTDDISGEAFEVDIDLGRFGQYSLELEAFSLYADDFKLKEVINNITHEFENPLPRTFMGRIKNEQGSQVRFTVIDNYFSGFIRDASGHCIYLEHQHSEPTTPTQIRIHANDDAMERFVNHTHDLVEQPPEYPTGIQYPFLVDATESVSDTGLYTAEIALIADYEAYSKATSSLELASELISILNYVDAYYNQLNIRYRLVEMVIFADPYSGDWPATNDAGLYLRAVDNWVADGGVSYWHDLATFWTGREIGYSYAWVNSVGQFGRHHLVEFWGMGDTRWLANFQSHEAGHNWGASHVAHNRKHIMSPYIYDGILDWNDTTEIAFQSYLQNVLGILDTENANSNSLLVFSSPSIVSDDNLDGMVDPGETIEVEIQIKNMGQQNSEISRVHLDITGTNQEWISVENQIGTIGIINADSIIDVIHTLQIHEDIPIPQIVELRFSVVSDLDSIWYDYSFGIGQRAEYKIDVSPAELIGNSNGKFDPGERVTLVLDLLNIGEREGESLEIIMTPDPGIQEYLIDYDTLHTSASLDIDEKRYLSIPLTILSDFPPGEKLGFQVKVSDSKQMAAIHKEYVVGLPENHLYYEDFEYSNTGSTNSGWSLQTGATRVNTEIGDTLSVFDKENNHWLSFPFDGDRSIVLDQHWAGPLRLISPQIDLTEINSAELSFFELRGWDNYSPQRKSDHSIQVQFAESKEGPWTFLSTIIAHEDDFQNWREIRNIDLAPALGEKIYISLYTFTQHYYWRLDNLTIVGAESKPVVLPEELAVVNYPNPFNNSTNIAYRIQDDSNVRLEIYNSRGQLISVLVDEFKSPALYIKSFETGNLASGVYFCRLLAGESSEMTKMLVLK